MSESCQGGRKNRQTDGKKKRKCKRSEDINAPTSPYVREREREKEREREREREREKKNSEERK